MATQIFVNLPIKDLAKSMAFYEAIGFRNNPQFTDDTAACMVVSDTIYVMLLTYDKFKQFSSKSIIDAKNTAGVLNSISMNSNQEVDELVEKAKRAGGNEYRDAQDYGFMRLRSFEDLDGHNWEVFYMDISKFPPKE
jgi:predicted lactoylglutathione lyase